MRDFNSLSSCVIRTDICFWQVLASLRSHTHAKTLVSHESLVIKKNKKKEESKRRSSVNLHSMPAPLSLSGRKVCLYSSTNILCQYDIFSLSKLWTAASWTGPMLHQQRQDQWERTAHPSPQAHLGMEPRTCQGTMRTPSKPYWPLTRSLELPRTSERHTYHTRIAFSWKYLCIKRAHSCNSE